MARASEVTIRAERAGEEPACRAPSSTRAFGDPVVGDARRRTAAAPGAGPTASRVVGDRDGELVGHVLFTRSWLDAPTRLVEILVLSPLSVAPEHQGRGIGERLVA